MFVKLHDSDPIKRHNPFYANIYLIETITLREDFGKLKIFYPSGKEWCADIKYLKDLLSISENLKK